MSIRSWNQSAVPWYRRSRRQSTFQVQWNAGRNHRPIYSFFVMNAERSGWSFINGNRVGNVRFLIWTQGVDVCMKDVIGRRLKRQEAKDVGGGQDWYLSSGAPLLIHITSHPHFATSRFIPDTASLQSHGDFTISIRYSEIRDTISMLLLVNDAKCTPDPPRPPHLESIFAIVAEEILFLKSAFQSILRHTQRYF